MKPSWFLAIWCAFVASQSASQDVGEAGQRWGAELVYEGDIGYRPCGDAPDTPDCLRDLGLSDEAIAFSYAMENDYSGATVGISFRELGAVDLVEARFIGNTAYYFPVLVNGQPELQNIPITRDLFRFFRDGASSTMLQRFPRAASLGPANVTAHRVLPNGTQRFVLTETIVNGCRACAVLGSAVSYLEISPNGDSQRRPIGLLLSNPSQSTEMNAEELQRRPASLQIRLNMLGYEAGSMDGVIGDKTRTALSRFKAEHCMIPDARLDNRTAQGLLAAKGFEVPCRPDQGRDYTQLGQLFETGIYVDSPEKCDLPNLRYEDIHLTQRFVFDDNIVFGYSARCEPTNISAGSTTRFEGMCSDENSMTPYTWRFSILSRTEFIDHSMPGGVQNTSPRRFTRCPDDSALRRNHERWFQDTEAEVAESDIAPEPGDEHPRAPRATVGDVLSEILNSLDAPDVTASDIGLLIDALEKAGKPAGSDEALVADLPYDSETINEIRDHAHRINRVGDGIDSLSDGWLSRTSSRYGVSWWQVYGDLLAAEKITSALANNDPQKALQEIDKWAGKKILSRTPTGSTILSSFQIASVAALPIELALDEFLKLVNRGGYRWQRRAYFAVRDAGLSHDRILGSNVISTNQVNAQLDKYGFFFTYRAGEERETCTQLGCTPITILDQTLGYAEQKAAERDSLFNLMRLEYESRDARADIDKATQELLDAQRREFPEESNQ